MKTVLFHKPVLQDILEDTVHEVNLAYNSPVSSIFNTA